MNSRNVSDLPCRKE